MIHMVIMEKVFRLRGWIIVIKGINYYEFYFHSWRNDIFDINACLLTCTDVFFHFCKSCKIRSKLDECPVILHRSDYAGDSFTDSKPCGIFFPCTEQFFMAEAYPSALEWTYNGFDIHSHPEPFSRMVYPWNGYGIYGYQWNERQAETLPSTQKA